MSGDNHTEQQRERAYELWEQAGRPEGRHEEFWQQAGQELGDGGASADERVDVAMEDTFPASDPPANSGITGPEEA